MNPNSKDEEDIYKKSENIIQRMNEEMRLSNNVLNSATYRRSYTIARHNPLSDNQNIVKIQDSALKLEFVNIDEDFSNKPKDSIFDDICSICSSKIYYEKYLCIICKDCIICPNCEQNHLHPVIKWKNNQLSSLNSIFLFLSNYNKEIQRLNANSNKGGLFGSSKTKYEFKLGSDNLSYTMQKNEKMEIPIYITNLSKSDVDCKKIKLALFGMNIKDLIIYNKEMENKIRRGETLKTTISIESNNIGKIYNFNIGLFSPAEVDIVYNTITFKMEVLSDNEEEQLNMQFKDYPEIVKESKVYKKSVKLIMENNKVKKDPMAILNALKQCHGNVHEAIKLLTSNKNIIQS
jgi:NACalpha-BTF3-like transcription factor